MTFEKIIIKTEFKKKIKLIWFNWIMIKIIKTNCFKRFK